MPHYVVVLLIFALTACSVILAARTARWVAADKDDEAEWRRALLMCVVAVNLILLVGALAGVSQAEIAALDAADGRSLLEHQLWLLGGTSSLMLLGALALRDPWVREAPTATEAEGRAFRAIVERLLPRFWWAALGLGVAFGWRARGIALLVALDLTVIWGLGAVMAAVRRGKS